MGDAHDCPDLIACSPVGYSYVDQPRPRADNTGLHTNHGGVVLFYRDDLRTRQIELPEYKSFAAIGAFLHCPRFSRLTMLSTLHWAAAREGDKKKKPETVLYYNRNKCGIDVLHNMCREMSTKAGWRRWPLAVFFNILDLAGVNAWIIYKMKTSSNISRRKFCSSCLSSWGKVRFQRKLLK